MLINRKVSIGGARFANFEPEAEHDPLRRFAIAAGPASEELTTIDRKLWIPPFPNGLPVLPCCACQIGFLNIVLDTLKEMETGPSEDAHSHDVWDVEWMDSRFTAFYLCTNPKCRHVVAVAGKVGYTSDYEVLPNGEWEERADPRYTPLAFAEPPPVIRLRTMPESRIGAP